MVESWFTHGDKFHLLVDKVEVPHQIPSSGDGGCYTGTGGCWWLVEVIHYIKGQPGAGGQTWHSYHFISHLINRGALYVYMTPHKYDHILIHRNPFTHSFNLLHTSILNLSNSESTTSVRVSFLVRKRPVNKVAHMTLR